MIKRKFKEASAIISAGIKGSLPIHQEPVAHIKYKDIKAVLSAKQWKNFCGFMQGQTSLVDGCYLGDFERWVKQGMLDRQLSHDWD